MVKYLETKKRKSQKNKTKKNIGGAPHKKPDKKNKSSSSSSSSEKVKTPEKKEYRSLMEIHRLIHLETPQKKDKSPTFIVDVLHDKNGNKIYKCPKCATVTGYAAPKDPKNTNLFNHDLNCPCKGKIHVEK